VARKLVLAPGAIESMVGGTIIGSHCDYRAALGRQQQFHESEMAPLVAPMMLSVLTSPWLL
jgi:hypothetical protein